MPPRARPWTALSGLLWLAAALALPARAGSPTASVVSPGSGFCGGAAELCEPGGDLLLGAFPPPVPLRSSVASLYGLDPGDELTSISFGVDSFTASSRIFVSVSSAALGSCAFSLLPDACSESGGTCPAPSQVGADVYEVGSPGLIEPNELAIDGDGFVTCFAPPPPVARPAFGLLEPLDDIDALDGCSLASRGPTTLPPAFFFTLAPGSPTLGLLGADPSDVLFAPPGGPAVVAWTKAALGLGAGDQIDALAIGSAIWLSLAPGSPSLVLLSATPGDILESSPPAPVTIVHYSRPFPNGFNLVANDDVDALAVFEDADADFVNDGCDNCPGVANNDQIDSDGNGFGDACPCIDGVDNDGDARIDAFDGGCAGPTDPAETDPLVECDDGLDNEGDGFADYAADPACARIINYGSDIENPECQDGVDNGDHDGKVDFDGGASRNAGVPIAPIDPGCGSFPSRRSETLTCGLGAELVLLLPLLVRRRRRGRADVCAHS